MSVALPKGLGLEELRRFVPHAALCVPDASDWSVGMHVHHCALSMRGVAEALAQSTPPPPEGRPSMTGVMLLAAGRIPRGQAESPSFALPDSDLSSAALVAHLDDAEAALIDAHALDENVWFHHTIFGVLTRGRAFRFVGMHNWHHLRIIDDLRRASRSA